MQLPLDAQNRNDMDTTEQQDLNINFPTLQSTKDNENFKIPGASTNKRVLSSSNSTSALTDSSKKADEFIKENKQKNNETEPFGKKVVHPPKKMKTARQSENVSSDLKPIKKFFEDNQSLTAISIEEVSAFLTETYGKSDTKEIALKYTTNIPEFTELLRKISDYITNKRLKARVLRIIKKLQGTDGKISFTDNETSTEELGE